MEETKVVFGNGMHGEVQLFSDGKKVGKMDISVAGGKQTVYHTEVDPEFKGRGFATLLLNQLVGYARENNLKIIPLCPYVLAQFKKHQETYKDVWEK